MTEVGGVIGDINQPVSVIGEGVGRQTRAEAEISASVGRASGGRIKWRDLSPRRPGLDRAGLKKRTRVPPK